MRAKTHAHLRPRSRSAARNHDHRDVIRTHRWAAMGRGLWANTVKVIYISARNFLAVCDGHTPRKVTGCLVRYAIYSHCRFIALFCVRIIEYLNLQYLYLGVVECYINMYNKHKLRLLWL